jgi:hypothetical protein
MPRGDINVVRRPAPPRLVRQKQDVAGAGPSTGRMTPEPVAARPASPPTITAEVAQHPASKEGGQRVALQLSYRTLVIAGAAVALVCCAGLALAGGLTWRAGGVENLIAGVTTPAAPDASEATPADSGAEASPLATLATPARRSSATPAPTSTSAPTQTPSPSPIPTDTPPGSSAAEPAPTVTPIIVVVTATPVPEAPTATARPTRTPARKSTEASAEIATELATVVLTPTFKYPAPVLLEPVNHGAVQGKLCILKWEPVGPLADDEYYALRLVYLQQGKPVYQGDQLKITDYRMPERFYYQADGPALEYKWFVFVERSNADGSTTQLSPESETFAFRWD